MAGVATVTIPDGSHVADASRKLSGDRVIMSKP